MQTLEFEFNAGITLALVDHARSFDRHYPLPSDIPQTQVAAAGNHRDTVRTPAGLWFVINDGVYLQSNAYPFRGAILYAINCDPGGPNVGEVVEFVPADLAAFNVDRAKIGEQDRFVLEICDSGGPCRLFYRACGEGAGIRAEEIAAGRRKKIPQPSS